jgi:hypothetical protein
MPQQTHSRIRDQLNPHALYQQIAPQNHYHTPGQQPFAAPYEHLDQYDYFDQHAPLDPLGLLAQLDRIGLLESFALLEQQDTFCESNHLHVAARPRLHIHLKIHNNRAHQRHLAPLVATVAATHLPPIQQTDLTRGRRCGSHSAQRRDHHYHRAAVDLAPGRQAMR